MRGLLTATVLALAALPASAADLSVRDGRTAPPLPGTDMMAGYLVLTNQGDESVAVTGAKSPDFGGVSLHRSIEQDGQSRMEPVNRLTVEPGARIAFEPGGLHLMLSDPAGQPEPGDELAVTLRTDRGPVDAALRVVERSELLRR